MCSFLDRNGDTMIKAVIFDLDGLLVDTEVTWHKVFQDVLREYGHDMTLEDYVGNYSGKTIIDNVNGIISNYNLPFDCETGVKKMVEGEERYLKLGVGLKKGAKELIEFLKEHEYKIALGTSSTKERAISILSFHGLDAYFDEIVCGYEVKRGKPYPDVFLTACERLNVLPEECLVLEDSEAGIQAAYSGHIPVICIPDLKKPRDTFADMTENVLPSLLDVIKYLHKYNDSAMQA